MVSCCWRMGYGEEVVGVSVDFFPCFEVVQSVNCSIRLGIEFTLRHSSYIAPQLPARLSEC